MKLSDIVINLRMYDEDPYGGSVPAIFAVEPWTPSSDALVDWASEKGGLPAGHIPIKFYLASIRDALAILGSEYDALVLEGEVDRLCRKLVTHIEARNLARIRSSI